MSTSKRPSGSALGAIDFSQFGGSEPRSRPSADDIDRVSTMPSREPMPAAPAARSPPTDLELQINIRAAESVVAAFRRKSRRLGYTQGEFLAELMRLLEERPEAIPEKP